MTDRTHPDSGRITTPCGGVDALRPEDHPDYIGGVVYSPKELAHIEQHVQQRIATFAAGQTTTQADVAGALAEAEYFIDNPSAWESFDQRVSDAIERATNALRASLGQTPQQAQGPGCTRSHPHESMDDFCKLRVQIAKLTNENARIKAQQAPSVQEDALADSQYLAGVQAGWNAAQATDPNAALRKIHESRAGYLKPLRTRAAQEGEA